MNKTAKFVKWSVFALYTSLFASNFCFSVGRQFQLSLLLWAYPMQYPCYSMIFQKMKKKILTFKVDFSYNLRVNELLKWLWSTEQFTNFKLTWYPGITSLLQTLISWVLLTCPFLILNTQSNHSLSQIEIKLNIPEGIVFAGIMIWPRSSLEIVKEICCSWFCVDVKTLQRWKTVPYYWN